MVGNANNKGKNPTHSQQSFLLYVVCKNKSKVHYYIFSSEGLQDLGLSLFVYLRDYKHPFLQLFEPKIAGNGVQRCTCPEYRLIVIEWNENDFESPKENAAETTITTTTMWRGSLMFLELYEGKNSAPDTHTHTHTHMGYVPCK